ncbi:MAG: alanine racemase, partial [bacterium]
SVDSLRLARKLDEAAADFGRSLRIFAQVNCSQEPQKHGFSLHEAPLAVADLAGLRHLHLEGLMGMAPAVDPEGARAAFRRLRGLRDSLAPSLGPLSLSMGMSDDFEIAVEEGADWVRIGHALFS